MNFLDSIKWNTYSLFGLLHKASDTINAAMITPHLVNRKEDNIKTIAKQISGAKHFNSIASLVDLQDGREYIFRGRNSKQLDEKTISNIRLTILQNVTPILIIRNDYAIHNKKSYVPSVGGMVTEEAFYSESRLKSEKEFLDSLKSLFPYIHIQLSIETHINLSANFALELAKHLRKIGFGNKILINPLTAASVAHEAIKQKLTEQGGVFARSRNSEDFGGDPIINTDGNRRINNKNFKTWLDKIKQTGRQYIIWCDDFANTATRVLADYL